MMRKLLVAAIVAAASLFTVSTAHAEPNRCYKLHDPHLVQMCLGDEAEMPGEPNGDDTDMSKKPCSGAITNGETGVRTLTPIGCNPSLPHDGS
jgi:hypothetical protein